ncbi:MAG: hypothetical protein IPM24_16710 [Bryobacterales bacterium]|nr:hypothetical protein [Bryobacterales bacterium]
MLRTPPAPRVYLLHEEKELSEPPFQGYEFDGVPATGTLRYLAALDTAKLEPGRYRLVVPLPDGENAIFREFALEEGRGSGSR